FGFLGSLLLNSGIAVVAYKVLTVADITWMDVLPGALVAGVGLTLLQTFGGLLVRHTLKNASATYGTFAVVIGLLSFIYLGAQIFLYAAEINVVKKKHLWPRSLVDAPTPGDQQVFTQRAKIEERRPDENIRVSFDKSSRSGKHAADRHVGAGPGRRGQPPDGKGQGADPLRLGAAG